MSPQEQLNIMYGHEEKIKALQAEPDERDLEASSTRPTAEGTRRSTFRSSPLL